MRKRRLLQRTYEVDLLLGLVLGVVLTIALSMVLGSSRRADDAIMTTQNPSSAGKILGYRRAPVRDQANAERGVFFR